MDKNHTCPNCNGQSACSTDSSGQSFACPQCGHSVSLSKVAAEELQCAQQKPFNPMGTPDRPPLMAAMVPSVLFLSSLGTPALRIGADLAFGYTAFYLSFLGILLFGEFGETQEYIWHPIACAMGALANLSFLFGFIFLLSRKRILWAVRASMLSFCLAVLVLLPLWLGGKLNGLYVGYGLWVASIFALALASWRRAAKMGEVCRPAFAYATPILLIILLPFGSLGGIGWFAQKSLRAKQVAMIEKERAHLEQERALRSEREEVQLRLRRQCLMNLEQIQTAKEEWARANGKSNEQAASLLDLAPYFKNSIIPSCPSGGKYHPGSLKDESLCLRHGTPVPTPMKD